MLVGPAVLARWRPMFMTIVQIAAIAAYTIGLTIIQPDLWLDRFGPLLKSLPVLAAVLVLGAIERDR